MKITDIARIITFILALILITLFINGLTILDAGSVSRMFSDPLVVRAVVFGLLSSITATLFSTVLGVPSGYYLARNKKALSRVLDAFFDIPLVLPPLIIGVLLLTFFNLGIIKGFYNFIFTFEGAVIAQFLIAFPFTVKTSKSAFELIPPVYERIAMTLGARPLRSFADTTLKLASGGIISGILMSWLRALGEFGATLMVGGGIAGKTTNIPIQIYLDMTEGDYQKGIALSLMIALISFLIIGIVRYVLFRTDKIHDKTDY
jgi:molybdate transport system permease protein